MEGDLTTLLNPIAPTEMRRWMAHAAVLCVGVVLSALRIGFLTAEGGP